MSGGMPKTIARTDDRNGRRVILIAEVCKDHSRWKGRTFYPVAGTEKMYARVNVDSPHFYYASERAGGGGGEGEGIVHELAKLVICETRELRIRFKDAAPLHLRFSEVQPEVPFQSGNVTYRIDLVGTLSEPAELVRRWGRELFIEILVCHKTEVHKVKALRREGRATIEVKVHDDWKDEAQAASSEADVNRIKAGIRSRFQRPLRAWRLHNPNWMEEGAAKDPYLPQRVSPVPPPLPLRPAPPAPRAAELRRLDPAPSRGQAPPAPHEPVDQPAIPPREPPRAGLLAKAVAWVRARRR